MSYLYHLYRPTQPKNATREGNQRHKQRPAKVTRMPRQVSAQTRSDTEMKKGVTRQLETVEDPVEKLRLLCLQRGCAGILGLGRVFRRMDDNGSGDLSREEFIKGLDDCGLSHYLSDKDYDKLFQRFDADRSGTIKFDEFIRAIRPHLNPGREALVMKAFQKMDHSRDSQITYEDIQGVYCAHSDPEYLNGQRTEREILTKFLESFEEGGNEDGIVTREEFLDYYTGVSASIDEDGYFDLMMRTTWKL